MELKNTNDNFMKSHEFNEKLNILNGSINLLLDEFKKIYVMSKTHPDNQEIQQQYANMVSSLDQLQSKLFSISNEIQTNVNKINKLMITLDVDIKKERENNRELKKKLGIVEDKSNTSLELINDYTDIYDKRYLRNWALGLSTIICITTIGVIFKKQGV